MLFRLFYYFKNDREQTEFSIDDIEVYTNNDSNIFYIFIYRSIEMYRDGREKYIKNI